MGLIRLTNFEDIVVFSSGWFTIISFLFVLKNRLSESNILILLVLFGIMLYFATVEYEISVENTRQKLAVVSDLSRSLVRPHHLSLSGLFFAWRNNMLQLLFGLHGATEVDYMAGDEEIKVCRDCMKEASK